MAPTPKTTGTSRKKTFKLTVEGEIDANKRRIAAGFKNRTGEELQEAAHVSRKSLQRFWGREDAITRDIFIAICEAIGVDWWRVADINPPNNLPDPYAKEFVGRDLRELDDCLQGATTLNITCTSLFGMGGVGKTEMAIQYAHYYRNKYSGGVCWVNVEPRFRLPEDSSASAKAVGDILLFAESELGIPPLGDDYSLEQQVEYCWRHWPHTDQERPDILIIFDNVNDYEEIQAFIPNSPRFRVLITSRKILSNAVPTFDVDPLVPEAAYAMLQSLIGKARTGQEKSIAYKICAEVGYLPQAIRLVGDFLADVQEWSLQDMLDELKEKRLAAAALCDVDKESAHRPLGLAAAFEISWEHLEKFEGAQRLACLLSLFAATEIEWTLVEQCLPDDNKRTLISLRDRQLVKFSLLRCNKNGTYQYHQLIKYFLSQKLEASPWIDEFILAVSKVLTDRVRTAVDNSTQTSVFNIRGVVPHVEDLLLAYSDRIPSEHIYHLYTSIAHANEAQGLLQAAFTWRNNCLSAVKQHLGNTHLYTAQSLVDLGRTTTKLGDYSAGESLLLEALNILEQFDSTHNLQIADALIGLGINYNRQNRLEDAERVLQRSVALLKTTKYLQTKDYKAGLSNLAQTYLLQSRYHDAEPLMQEALEKTIQIFGKNSFEYGQSLSDLGILKLHLEQYTDAEPLLREVLELKKSILGTEHPSIAIGWNNLASVLARLGKNEEAEAGYGQSLNLRIRLYGEEHPKVARGYLNLGVCYRDQGKYEQAEPALVTAQQMNTRLLGPTHRESVSCLYMLAGLYKRQGRLKESKTLFLEALDLAPTAFGSTNKRTGEIHASLGEIYAKEGCLAQAVDHIQQAYDIRSKVLGIDHKSTQETLETLNTLKEQLAASEAV